MTARKRLAPSERRKTDDSLRAERLDTDGALKGDVESAERNADGVVDRAREVADAVLSEARLKADQESLRTPRPAKAVVDERAQADHVVRVEREHADVGTSPDARAGADLANHREQVRHGLAASGVEELHQPIHRDRPTHAR